MLHDKKITICACVSRNIIDKEEVASLAAALDNDGYEIIIEADLCKSAASPEPEIATEGVIAACHERAVRSLLYRTGLKAERIIDIRSGSYTDALEQLGVEQKDNEKYTLTKEVYIKKIESFPQEISIDAWYPVLDKKRCTNCGKCHDFCLFGVYALDKKVVKVIQPQNCKNGCPACARVCPSKAVIFPKYDKSPINGGLTDDETFNPDEMDAMYKERLKYKLEERRKKVALLTEDDK
jgi:Pyruvate/2-oxoacid:ferredoxin oxidoreductase delta subunit